MKFKIIIAGLLVVALCPPCMAMNYIKIGRVNSVEIGDSGSNGDISISQIDGQSTVSFTKRRDQPTLRATIGNTTIETNGDKITYKPKQKLYTISQPSATQKLWAMVNGTEITSKSGNIIVKDDEKLFSCSYDDGLKQQWFTKPMTAHKIFSDLITIAVWTCVAVAAVQAISWFYSDNKE